MIHQTLGFVKYIIPKNKAIGFYGYWTMDEAHFSFITSLPYKPTDVDFVVNNVDNQGNVSVKTNYGNVLVKPGERVDIEWVTNNDTPSCEILISFGLENYGFINDDQVVILREGEWYP